jgi:hypothetical protein
VHGEPHVVSQPWLAEGGDGRVGRAELAPLLGEAGVAEGAVEVLFGALDRGSTAAWSSPTSAARSPEALVGDALLA